VSAPDWLRSVQAERAAAAARSATCPACGKSPHPFQRLERVAAATFNGTFRVLETITFSRA
jgi:hypothetical protein